jgi:site-specific DNA recombinase
MRAIIYRRISTNEDKQQHSLGNQQTLLNALCVSRGFEVVADLFDCASGKSLKRPAIQEALRMLQDDEADVLVVHSLSRLSRNLRDVCSLVEDVFQEKSLVILQEGVDTTTPQGRLMISLMTSVNAFEREIIGERISQNLKEAQRKGVRLGCPKYGYFAGGEGKINPDEMVVVQKIKKMKSEGVILRKIVDALKAEGFKTRKGTNFSLTQVHLIAKYDYGADLETPIAA